VPERADWDQRLNSVLRVIYLIFNEGWTAGAGDAPIRTQLCDEAIWLARLMTTLAPGEPEIEGLLALMLLNHARRAARFDGDAGFVPLERQDHSLWDQPLIDEGLRLLDIAVARRLPGPFQIQAAISALHVHAKGEDDIDWPQILLLYDRLLSLAPSPVVALNRAVALAETGRLARARQDLAALADPLGDYQPFHAASAELARRAGDSDAARTAYDHAIDLSRSTAEQDWLKEQRDTL
jgi:RNA polymerase sigma-70 factor (ECF subfamily)